MTEKQVNRWKPSLLAATLLTAFVVGITPTVSAECGDLDDRCTYPGPSDGAFGPDGVVDCAGLDPGDPGNSVVDATLWYVGQNTFLACGFLDSVEDSMLLHGGNMAWQLGVAASGGVELFNTTGFVPGVLVYQATVEDVVGSQFHDTCGALIGHSNPTCGTGNEVPQTLQCPGGLEVPNPIGGGLVGDSLDNSNGALQATCILVDAGSNLAPNEDQVLEYVGDVQAILVDLNGEAFLFASNAADALCIYLTGDTPCV